MVDIFFLIGMITFSTAFQYFDRYLSPEDDHQLKRLISSCHCWEEKPHECVQLIAIAGMHDIRDMVRNQRSLSDRMSELCFKRGRLWRLSAREQEAINALCALQVRACSETHNWPFIIQERALGLEDQEPEDSCYLDGIPPTSPPVDFARLSEVAGIVKNILQARVRD